MTAATLTSPRKLPSRTIVVHTVYPSDPPKDFNEWANWIHRQAKKNS